MHKIDDFEGFKVFVWEVPLEGSDRAKHPTKRVLVIDVEEGGHSNKATKHPFFRFGNIDVFLLMRFRQ